MRLAFACTALLATLAPLSAARPREATPSDVSMAVTSLLPRDGTVSAHEPLLARLTLTNLTADEVTVRGPLRLEVHDSRGRLVAETPRRALPRDGLTTLPVAHPRRTLAKWVILPPFAALTRPGEYSVRFEQLLSRGGPPVLAEAVTHVRVLPFDGPRLRARCAELFAPWQDFARTHTVPDDSGELPAWLRLWALYSVRHDAVLPYLSTIAHDWGGSSELWSALSSLHRIRSPRAEALFRSFTSRRDEVGRTARRVAREGPDEEYEGCFGDNWVPAMDSAK